MSQSNTRIAFAVAAAVAAAASIVPQAATAVTPGKYVAGDFHNHTTCNDGQFSLQKVVKKATDTVDTPWGLDWFVYSNHGANGTGNCTLVEDATLDTPLYPFVTGFTAATNWASSIGPANVYGDQPATGIGTMWRWQATEQYEYPLVEYLATLKNKPMFVGLEQVTPGHEHTSSAIIAGQMPLSLDTYTLPTTALPVTGQRYTPIGNDTALAQWNYCFDVAADTSRGNGVGLNNTTNNSGFAHNWDCSVPGSANSASPLWNATGHKLVTANGTNGHIKTVEAVKWMASFYNNESYFVPAHLERAGPFDTASNKGFNVEHLRDFNNAAPNVAFGFESQPGHGAAANRGEYQIKRNNIGGVLTDSVGGTTYGGTGVYAAYVGGVWDALLGEGRNWWFFASSDWHSRSLFGGDDRRSTQDFWPGEYQRNYTMVRNGTDKLRPQTIVDGLRTGNNWAASGQLVDSMAFLACASYPGFGARTPAQVEALARTAAYNNTDVSVANCATMGQKLKVRAGANIIVAVVVRDPAGTNFSPYSFPNPSLVQIGVNQPLNAPVLDHVDLIRGYVTGYKTPGAADYSGEWPRNTNWLQADGTVVPAGLGAVPAAAKNTSAAVVKTWAASGSVWTPVTSTVDGTQFLSMSFTIPSATASQYVRLRGTNLPPAVPYETDANGNPLADVYTNANDTTRLTIPCTTTGTNVPGRAPNPAVTTWTQAMGTIDGCPVHLATATSAALPAAPNPIVGQQAVSFDVAAWSDLWFYSNPIYVEVAGATPVAGVN
jgi:hypothetical protein